MGCSWSVVVSIYQKWSKEGTVVNRQQGHRWPRPTDARGEQRLAHVIQSNKRATVTQIAEEINAGSDRKVSEHISLLRMGLHGSSANKTWPPNSLDLNIIEHLWDALNKQVCPMEAPPCNLQELKDLLLTSWY